MRKCILPFLGLVLVVSPALAQETLDFSSPLPVDPQVTVGTLENGLRYYIRPNQRPENRAELRLVVNAGSVLEADDQRGLAHFAEHMAFNGTESFPKQALIDYLERIGMRFGPDINAYTSFDETVYQLQVPTDSTDILHTAFQILEEWAHKVSFDADQIEAERGVVIEEWRLGRGAEMRMFDKQFPILFAESRYAERLPIGNKETLESFPHEVLTKFYNDWYRPDLMAVIAVGDFDPAAIEELIVQHFTRLEARSEPERILVPVPDHEETLFAIATDPEATSSSVSLYHMQPLREFSSIGDYRQLIVERLYNRILNARLFEVTQQAEPPFLFASSGQGRLIRSKEVYVLGAGVAENAVEPGLEALLTEAERVARHGFTETELERHKIELLRGIERSYAEREKTNSNRYTLEYVNHYLMGEPIPGVELEYGLHERLLPEIALQEVNRLAREWLTDRNRVITVNAPDKPEVAVPSEAQLLAAFTAVKGSEIAPYEDTVDDAPLIASTPMPGRVLEEETYPAIGVTSWRLSNGARVLFKPTDFKDDEIVFRASSPGGTSLVADEDHIAAVTAAQVIGMGGLGEYNLVDLQKKLAGKAVDVSPSIGDLYEQLGGSASPEDIEMLFQLIYLTVTAPRRDEISYQAFRSQVDAILANRSASPDAAFVDTLTATLTQHHFRARPPTAAVYEEMNLGKSFSFYKDRYADVSDFTFVFVGNFDLETMRPLVTQYVASLPSTGRVESWRDVGVRPPDGVVEREVYRGVEPASRTQIVFSSELENTRENRHVLRSLGELLQIKLRERLREDLGGTYSVSVSGIPEMEPTVAASLRIGFGADPARLEELVAVVFEEIEKLKQDGPDQTDVEKVQESQRRGRETDLKQNRYWLTQLVLYDRFDLPLSDILDYEELVSKLTPEKIQDAARRYIPTDNYVRVSLYPTGSS